MSFPQTPANERALDVLRNSYAKLNLPQLSEDSQQILAKTYPESRYLTGHSGQAVVEVLGRRWR